MTRGELRSRGVALYLATGVAGYPLVSFLAQGLGVTSRAVTFPFRGIMVFGAATILLAVLSGRLRARSGVVGLLLTGFWVLFSVRLALDLLFAPVTLGRPAGEYVLFTYGMVLIPMLAFFTLLDRPTAIRWFRLTVAFFAVGCFIGVIHNYQHIGQQFLRVPGNEFLSPITFGHMGASVLMFATLQLVQRPRDRFLPVWVALAAVPAALVCLVLAASRGPIVALAAGMLLIAAAGWVNGGAPRVLALVAVLGITIPSAVAVAQRAGSALIERMTRSPRRGSSVDERLRRYQGAWEQFTENPLLGSSLDERGSLGYPHNLVLESFMAVGIFGGVLFVLILLLCVFKSIMLLVRDPAYGWIGLLFVQRAVGGMFSGSLYTSNEFWYMVAAVASASFATRTLARRPAPVARRAAIPLREAEPA